MSEHTPGPWFVMQPGCYALDDLVDNELRRCSVYAAGFDENHVHHIVRGGVSEPDARLIAAAPDLLEACKDLVRLSSDPTTLNMAELSSAAMRMKTAIAKAEGVA